MAGSGDGHIAKTGIEQVWVDGGIGVDEDALGSQSLRTVAGDGVAVVEMTMFGGMELSLTVIVETDKDMSSGADGFDLCEVTVGDTECLGGCGELDAVADSKLAFDLAVNADTGGWDV